MCSCDVATTPDFFREQLRRSKRVRRCYECARAIAAGERYNSVSGKWDGSVHTYAICLPCDALRSAYEHVNFVLTDDAECSPAFGELLRDVRECFSVQQMGTNEAMRDLCERKRWELLKLTGKVVMATIDAGLPLRSYPYRAPLDANGAPLLRGPRSLEAQMSRYEWEDAR